MAIASVLTPPPLTMSPPAPALYSLFSSELEALVSQLILLTITLGVILDQCGLWLCLSRTKGWSRYPQRRGDISLSRDSAFRKELLYGKLPASSTDLTILPPPPTHTHPTPPSIRDWVRCAVCLKWSNGTVRNPEATQIRNGWRNRWSWDESITNVGGGSVWKRQQVGSWATDVRYKLGGWSASSQRKAPHLGGQALPAGVEAPGLDRHLSQSLETIVRDTWVTRERVEQNCTILSSLRSWAIGRAHLFRGDSVVSFYTYPLSLLQHSS